MKNNLKKYLQQPIGLLLLLVFIFCLFIPVSANTNSNSKYKVYQKSSKAKSDKDDFVFGEELEEDVDDDIDSTELIYFINSFCYSLHATLTSDKLYNNKVSSIKLISLPLFLSIRTLRI